MPKTNTFLSPAFAAKVVTPVTPGLSEQLANVKKLTRPSYLLLVRAQNTLADMLTRANSYHGSDVYYVKTALNTAIGTIKSARASYLSRHGLKG